MRTLLILLKFLNILNIVKESSLHSEPKVIAETSCPNLRLFHVHHPRGFHPP